MNKAIIPVLLLLFPNVPDAQGSRSPAVELTSSVSGKAAKGETRRDNSLSRSTGARQKMIEQRRQRIQRQLTKDQRAYQRKLVRIYHPIFLEFLANERNDEDGFFSMDILRLSHALLGSTESEDSRLIDREWNKLLQRRPDLRSNRPSKLSDVIQKEEELKARKEQIYTSIKNWKPSDKKARVFTKNKNVMLVHQYFIEAYELNEGEELWLGGEKDQPFSPVPDYLLLDGSSGTCLSYLFQRNGKVIEKKPIKIIKFGQRVLTQKYIDPRGVSTEYLIISTNHYTQNGYSPSGDEEREILSVLAERGEVYKFMPSKYDFLKFYGVVALNGDIIVRLEDRYWQSHENIRGELIHHGGDYAIWADLVPNYVGGGGYLKSGKVRGYIVWNENSGIKYLSSKEGQKHYPYLIDNDSKVTTD